METKVGHFFRLSKGDLPSSSAKETTYPPLICNLRLSNMPGSVTVPMAQNSYNLNDVVPSTLGG